MSEYGLTRTGFLRKRYADIWANMQSRAKSLFGDDVNLSESSPLGLFAQLNAWELANTWQVAEDVYHSAFIDSAEGNQLDLLARNLGIDRRPAEPATGYVTFTGAQNGIKLEEGLLVATQEGTLFQVTEWGWIDNGAGTVPVEAVVPGEAGNVSAATITSIVQAQPTGISAAGLLTVTNVAVTSGGLEAEQDWELRERYKRSVQFPGQATIGAIESRLLDLDGVRDAYVRENDTQDNIEIEPTVFLFPKTIYPLVDGGDSQEIGNTIHQTKAGGIQSWATDSQGVVVEATDSRGYTHFIGFDRPRRIYVNALIKVDVSDIYEVGDFDEIVTSVTEYLDGLRINKDVIYNKILSLAQCHSGVKDVDSVDLYRQAFVELVSDGGARLEFHAAPITGQIGADGNTIDVEITNDTYDTGTSTDGTTITLTDAGKSWSVDELAGMYLTMTGGAASGEEQKIVSNTATQITVEDDFSAAIATDTYQVWPDLTVSFSAGVLTVNLGGYSSTAEEIMLACLSIDEIDCYVFADGVFDPAEDTMLADLAGGETVVTNIEIGLRQIAKAGLIEVEEAII